jgi:hypothetical protein
MERAMSRWFRAYADTHRNPKVASLSDRQFRLWHNLLCIAAENDGVIPSAEELKSILNVRLDYLLRGLEGLLKGGLIDPLRGGYAPRNWDKRQYKSDTSTDRVHKFRAKRNVSETPPDTEADTETEKKEEEGGDKSPASYAFFGRTIRLRAFDLDKWRKAFHAVPDFDAELISLDAWFETQPEAKRKSWFHVTAGALNRKHQELMAIRKEADASGGWDGMA